MRSVLEVSDFYWKDSQDYLGKFLREWDHVNHTKHRRIRACVDLRFAFECVLKSLIIYGLPHESSPVDALGLVFKYGHNLERLETEAVPVAEQHSIPMPNVSKEFNLLQVDLRYSVESHLLWQFGENFYNKTFRIDQWVLDSSKLIKSTIDAVGSLLDSRSSVVSGEELWELISVPNQNTNQQLGRVAKWAEYLKEQGA